MSVMTVIPHIVSHERHYVPSPHRTSGSTRGDMSSPYAYAYAQKHAADTMTPRDLSSQTPAHQPLEWEGGCCAAIHPATPSWQRAGPTHPRDAPLTSLANSVLYANQTPPKSLNGAFSGSWSALHPTSAPSAQPAPLKSGSWTLTRDTSSDRMDEDDADEDSSDGVISERGLLPVSRNGSAVDLPCPPNRAPKLSESDILLRASSGKVPPAAISHDQSRASAASWESEDVRLPPIRSDASQMAVVDYSPYIRGPPAKRVQMRLPSFPDFVQGSSRPSVGDTSSRSSRRGTASPPPSPSPSVASFYTNAHSAGQSDTEPTEEEDVDMGECKHRASLPPPSRNRPWPARPSPPLDDADYDPLLNPPRPVTSTALVTGNVALQAPGPLKVGTPEHQAAPQAEAASSKHRRTRPRTTEPKEYRFVASTFSQGVSRLPHMSKEIERGRPPVAHSGSKRKLSLSPSPTSSEDLPLSVTSRAATASAPQRQTQPQAQSRPRTQRQPDAAPPKRRGRPPRPAYDIESVAPIDPDSPEAKGQFPEYRYECQRGPMPCMFAGCNALLTGKKAEMTTHLKAHFHGAGGRTLLCPWEVLNSLGERVPCGQSFRDSANMGRHVTTRHVKVEEYQCGKCGRPFARRDAALRHMKTMCSPEKQRKREMRRNLDVDVESEDEDNDADNSGSSMED